jgi:hypothetical protein
VGAGVVDGGPHVRSADHRHASPIPTLRTPQTATQRPAAVTQRRCPCRGYEVDSNAPHPCPSQRPSTSCIAISLCYERRVCRRSRRLGTDDPCPMVLCPRIERRVRAQERWEQFLVEFASLIDGSVKRAHDAARSAWVGWHALHEVAAARPDSDPERLRDLNERDRVAFRQALDAWGDTMVRADWLARRISGDYRVAGSELRIFYSRWLFYRTEQRHWNAWDDRPSEDPSDWEQSSEAHQKLVDAVETLSLRIGLPVGPWQRFQARSRERREQRPAADTA